MPLSLSLSLSLALSLVFALPSAALTLKGPELGASSNFGQWWQPRAMAAALALPVKNFRDEIYWSRVERNGHFVFDRMDTRYPDMMAAGHATMGLLIYGGNPAFDHGKTPHTPAAIAAFGQYAAKTAQRFPAITSIEIGNEFNSQDFVSGPVKAAGLHQRALDYLKILKAVHAAVKAADPKLKILGGGVHSIPVGYLRPMFEAGAARYMDALAIHTYTTPAEQLVRQVAVLRRLPGMAEMPIDVTEFGEPQPEKAPGHFLRNYCQMALSGVERAVWYSLSPRGDGMTTIVTKNGDITPVGETYRMIGQMMEGKPVQDVAPDPFTYACLFGGTTLVIWGAPRDLQIIRPDLRAFDDTGHPLNRDHLRLSETDPIVITGQTPVSIGSDIHLAPQQVVADSYDQFAYPGMPGQPSDPFDRYAVLDGTRLPLETHEGQDRGGVPWTPYLGAKGVFTARLMARDVLPSPYGDRKVDIVQSYTAPADMRVAAQIALAPDRRNQHGVTLTVSLNGQPIVQQTVRQAFAQTTKPLDLHRGDRLDFIVGPNSPAIGEAAAYRFTLRKPQP